MKYDGVLGQLFKKTRKYKIEDEVAISDIRKQLQCSEKKSHNTMINWYISEQRVLKWGTLRIC